MTQIDQDLAQLTTLADTVVAAGLPLGAPRGRDKQTTRPVVSPDGSTSFAVDHIPDRKLQAAYQNLAAAAGTTFPTNGPGLFGSTGDARPAPPRGTARQLTACCATPSSQA
ncbi:MAG: hypothetical protein FWE61_08075 [Micrococcales bacterium]|nr:hypothetical protein [Micrococcales bacterium]